MAKTIIITESQSQQLKQSLTEMAYPSTWNVEEFANIKSYAGRIKYCQERLHKLGAGSSRIVYQIDDEKCLKLAKNQKGIAQNEAEANSYAVEAGIGAQIYNWSDNFEWVEMQLAAPVTQSSFKRVTGYYFSLVEKFVLWTYNHYANEFKKKFIYIPKQEEALFISFLDESHPFFAPLYNYMSNTGIESIGDLTKISSYGIVITNGDEDVVLIDYGLTEDILNKYYKR